jgi:hypothetical protein
MMGNFSWNKKVIGEHKAVGSLFWLKKGEVKVKKGLVIS